MTWTAPQTILGILGLIIAFIGTIGIPLGLFAWKQIADRLNTVLARQSELDDKFEKRMVDSLKEEADKKYDAGRKDGAMEELSKSVHSMTEQMNAGFANVDSKFEQVHKRINEVAASAGKKGGTTG